MPRNMQLLLLQNVENLGIVGDLVKVKGGHARNFLLPQGLAEFPTEERIEELKDARAAAQAELERVRGERESLIQRMEELELKLTRSANDLGALYGSVTQRDIGDALEAEGYPVEYRAIRLKSAIKRTGEYHVPIQFERDLKTEITVIVESDRPIEELEQPAEPEGEAEGEAAGGEGEAPPKPTHPQRVGAAETGDEH